jgi:hypothetical protein
VESFLESFVGSPAASTRLISSPLRGLTSCTDLFVDDILHSRCALYLLHVPFLQLDSPRRMMARSADVPETASNGPLPAGLHRNINRRSQSMPDCPTTDDNEHAPLKPTQLLFAGRVGGNQEFIIDRNDPAQAALLRKTPDAAPFMSLAQTFDLRGFREVDLWKAAFIEGIGELFPYRLQHTRERD